MIVPTLARLLIREHIYKPIQGKVLTLGRQTISMTYDEVMELFQQEDYIPPQDVLDEITITRDKKTRVGAGTDFITDELFFALLGVKELITMDVSSYEKADIVHDLNKPIPDELYEQFDFIIDGGTFDHMFDVRTAFENVAKMMKCGGRILQWNAASNFTGAAYMSFGPDMFYDYYVLNQFIDCKVYVAETDTIGQREMWDFYEFNGTDRYSHFQSNRILMVVVLAEKGPTSTWDLMPIQGLYRDSQLWLPYRIGQKAIQSSGRNPLAQTQSGYKLVTRKIELYSLLNMYLKKLKEKGFVWCFNRFVSIKMKGEGLEGYRYIGKI